MNRSGLEAQLKRIPLRKLVRKVGSIHEEENNLRANFWVKYRFEKSGARCRCGKVVEMNVAFDIAIAKPVVMARFHLSVPLRRERISQLPDAIGGVSMNMRSQEAQHLPAFGLELVGLSGVMDALPDRRMEFQAVGINQDAPGRDIREICARQ